MVHIYLPNSTHTRSTGSVVTPRAHVRRGSVVTPRAHVRRGSIVTPRAHVRRDKEISFVRLFVSLAVCQSGEKFLNLNIDRVKRFPNLTVALTL